MAGIPCRERFDTERTAVVKPESEYTRKECEMALKYSFKLFFLKCIFEFMINTAPPNKTAFTAEKNALAYQCFSGVRGAVVKDLTLLIGD